MGTRPLATRTLRELFVPRRFVETSSDIRGIGRCAHQLLKSCV